MNAKDQAALGHHRPGTPAHDLGDPPDLPGEDDLAEAGQEPGPRLVTVAFLVAAIRRGVAFWCTATVAGLLIGLGIYAASPPAYQASTSVLLQLGPYENFNTAPQDNQAIAESRAVAMLALHNLGLRESASKFLEGYTVGIVSPNVLSVTARAPSPGDAIQRANAVAAAFLQFRVRQLEAEQQLAGSQAGEQAAIGTKLAVKRSVVLDAATPTGQSRLRLIIVYAGTGLVLGLALGIGIVVVRAIASGRLYRREDVAQALAAPVTLSLGRVRRRRWRPRPRGLAVTRGATAQRIAMHLAGAVPVTSRGTATLAIVPVDGPGIAAASMVSLAVSRARQGARVVVADLCSGAPAARLLKADGPGVHMVSAEGAQLTVAVPADGDTMPAGPFGSAPQGQQAAFTGAVSNACASADLLLTLVTLDPSLGGGHLPTWATTAVAVVTAGRSTATRLHAVGEMVRSAGTRLVSAVLTGSDKTDESFGGMPVPDPGGDGKLPTMSYTTGTLRFSGR